MSCAGSVRARRSRSRSVSPRWTPSSHAISAAAFRIPAMRSRSIPRSSRDRRGAATETSGRRGIPGGEALADDLAQAVAVLEAQAVDREAAAAAIDQDQLRVIVVDGGDHVAQVLEPPDLEP